jgi:hypothetical protein
MNGAKKSDDAVVATKLANPRARAPGEPVEPTPRSGTLACRQPNAWKGVGREERGPVVHGPGAAPASRATAVGSRP